VFVIILDNSDYGFEPPEDATKWTCIMWYVYVHKSEGKEEKLKRRSERKGNANSFLFVRPSLFLQRYVFPSNFELPFVC